MNLKQIVDQRLATGDRAILETVRQWRTAAGSFHAFYFRGEVCRGEDTRVYAVIGVPKGRAVVPGVLHYHGGGQTANPDLVAKLVDHGYAAISFDWTGPRDDREHVTRWGGCTPVYPGIAPDQSLIVRALTAGRQAVTILAEHPRVDATRIGQFGISWGGFQTWLLNAVDDRLSCAVAIYGCGVTDAQIVAYEGEADFDVAQWQACFGPARFARDQQAPLLFLNGTNDFFGWMETFRKLGRDLDDRHRAAFAPHFNHSIGSLSPTLLAWLDAHLRDRPFPARPTVACTVDDDALILRSPALPGAETATFYVAATRGVGPDFFWQPVPATRRGANFVAGAGNHGSLVYVHQTLLGNVQASSFPIRCRGPVAPPPAAALSLDAAVWYGPAPVDPLQPFAPMRPGLELDATPGFQFNTRQPIRPCRGLRLRAAFAGDVADPVTVAVLKYAGSPREHRYEAQVTRADLAAGIPLTVLKDAKHRALPPTGRLSHLYLGGQTKTPGVVRLVAAEFMAP